MKQLLQTKTGTVILAVLGVLVVGAVAWELGGKDWWSVRGAIRDIAEGRNIPKARATLERLNDRGYVLKKLEEAISDDAFTVRNKIELLKTIAGSTDGALNEPRALRRALASPSLSAQRAACLLMYGDADSKTRCGEIALAWLKDEGASDRSLAAMVCRQLNLEEAQPIFLAIVERDPKTQDDLLLFQQALFALKDPKPPELIDRLLRMASDPALDADARGVALEALQRTKDGPRDRILELSIGILEDANADPIFRKRAGLGLRAFPEDRAWQALEGVVLSEKEKDHVLQRQCLFALGNMSPSDPAVADRFLDRLTQILLDKRVYHSPYFGLRIDVATALCALNVREPIVIDIMCDYLVDDDKDDRRERLVRQQGWLTLWALTGERLNDGKLEGAGAGSEGEVAPVPAADIFDYPPPPLTDRKAAREFFFTRGRPNISPAQNAAVAKVAQDLAWMQKARQVYQSSKSRIVERWRDEAAKAEEAKKLAAERKAKAAGAAPKEEEKKPAGPEKQDAGAAEVEKPDQADPQKPN